MGDPLRQLARSRRAAKRRGHATVDPPRESSPALGPRPPTQGVRSELRFEPPRPSMDNLIREAAWAARGRPPGSRLNNVARNYN